ncbi:MAG: hypothetical protein QOE82_1060 [Thermoanaerobaculia bacterium]|nr:hypothetical protein [Thermoanaerobaculia bacterium]
MRRFLFRAAFAAATVIVTATAFSQDAPKPKLADAQNSYEPRSTTGAGQVLLAQFAGDWDVVKTFYPSNGGAPVQTKGECRQVMVQDGHFLQSDFTFFERDGKKSTGVGISGFDGKTNRFTTVWYDSRQTTFSIRQSDGTFDGKEIVLYATSLDPDRPGRRTVARAHLEENGRVLLHRHFLIEEGGKERMMIELRMTRKTAPSKSTK